MKKSLLVFLMISLFGSFTVTAQNEKGSWFLSGLNIMSFQVGSIKEVFSGSDVKSNISEIIVGPSILSGNPSIVFAPTLNYRITNKLSGGIFFDINSQSSTDKSNSGGKSTYSVFAIGPAVRYTFENKSKFKPLAEAKIGFGSINGKSSYGSSKQSMFEWYLGTGGSYFISPKVGIDFSLGYRNMVMKDKESSNNSKATLSVVNFGAGIIVGF